MEAMCRRMPLISFTLTAIVTLTNIQVPVLWCHAADECLHELGAKHTHCKDAI
jgi:hypothetical protein